MKRREKKAWENGAVQLFNYSPTKCIYAKLCTKKNNSIIRTIARVAFSAVHTTHVICEKLTEKKTFYGFFDFFKEIGYFIKIFQGRQPWVRRISGQYSSLQAALLVLSFICDNIPWQTKKKHCESRKNVKAYSRHESVSFIYFFSVSRACFHEQIPRFASERVRLLGVALFVLVGRRPLTLELLLQNVDGGDDRGVDVVQPGSQSLLVVELLECLEGSVVAPGWNKNGGKQIDDYDWGGECRREGGEGGGEEGRGGTSERERKEVEQWAKYWAESAT